MPKLDARDAAAILEHRYGGRDMLAGAIVEATSAERVSLTHRLLASLPLNEAVTTNHDVLFERAWRDAGRDFRVLPRESAEGSRRWLLKLHGLVDDTRRIVLSRDDYLRFEGQGLRPPAWSRRCCSPAAWSSPATRSRMTTSIG